MALILGSAAAVSSHHPYPYICVEEFVGFGVGLDSGPRPWAEKKLRGSSAPRSWELEILIDDPAPVPALVCKIVLRSNGAGLAAEFRLALREKVQWNPLVDFAARQNALCLKV